MSRTTRRTLLQASAFAAAPAPVLLHPEGFGAATTRRDLYTRSRFPALRHKSFRLQGPNRHWRVRLTRVRNLPACEKRDQHAFSLTFRCGSAGPEQGSYVLRRPG